MSVTAQSALAKQRDILMRAITVLQEEVHLLDRHREATWITVGRHAKLTELARHLLVQSQSHDDE